MAFGRPESARRCPVRVAVYVRCSTLDQHPETQVVELRNYCAARGWQDVTEYIDRGESGVKTRRPALDRLLADAKALRIDTIVVVGLDRLGRSVGHVVQILELLRHLGITFLSLREQLDSASPVGGALMAIIAVLSALERDLIRARVKAGLHRAKLEGRRLGRKPLEVDPRRLESVLSRKLSARQAARELGCSTASAWRLIRARATGAAEVQGASHPAEEVANA